MRHKKKSPRKRKSVASSPVPFSTALALLTLATGFTAQAKDILRGTTTLNHSPAAGAAAASSAAAIAQATADAQATLTRTTAALQSIQAAQDTARLVAQGGANYLTGSLDVSDGLATGNGTTTTGGLVPDSGVAVAGVANPVTTWKNAGTPVQTVTGNKTTVTITQTGEDALLYWSSFNVGKNTTLVFNQSAGGSSISDWIAFNKINDPSGVPSQILGSIRAGGQVYLIDQNGIIFGGASQINTHSLIASSLPINDNLLTAGVLNNPDHQFLFSQLAIPAGNNGTPAFNPPAPLTPDGRDGDVVVQAGATINGNGGCVALIGSNVSNGGTISSAKGQVILAAGLQAGLEASSDPGLRGFEVYVGSVDPTSSGVAANTGIINVSLGDAVMTGMTINQLGAIASTTSVSLNGRIDLLANYDAVSNPSYNPLLPEYNSPFNNSATGTVTLGPGSVTEILPDTAGHATVTASSFTLFSQINLQGLSIHLAAGSVIDAPNATIAVNAGNWFWNGNTEVFTLDKGSVAIDSGAWIDASGSQDVSASVAENIIAIKLGGTELADSPLERNGPLRGQRILVDLTQTGNFDGKTWYGTPLANLSGYVGLIQHTVGELTTNGGSVTINAGDSVVVQNGAQINVSGGWINYQGANVKTTNLVSNGLIYNISQATPNRVYDGNYGGFTVDHSKWGVSETYSNPLLSGGYYEPGYIQGGNGGSVSITAPMMTLNGSLTGLTVAGARQETLSSAPASSSLSLDFAKQYSPLANGLAPWYSPTAPAIVFSSGNAPANTLLLPPDLVNKDGFGNLTINNGDGAITVASGVSLALPVGGSLTFSAANIDVEGAVSAPGGSLSFNTCDFSPYTPALWKAEGIEGTTPLADPTRGSFILGPMAVLSTAGLIVNDRDVTAPITTQGGKITINAYNADLKAGGAIDVSGGVESSIYSNLTYGSAGSIVINAGQDPNIASLLGGSLSLGSTVLGYSEKAGGSLGILAPAIQIGGGTLLNGDSSGETLWLNRTAADGALLQPDFFGSGGFSSFSLTGLGEANGQSVTAVDIAPGAVIAPQVSSWHPVMMPGGGVAWESVLKAQPFRPPVSLSLCAAGVTDTFSKIVLSRGDFVMGTGASIDLSPGNKAGAISGGNISIKGGSVEVLGSIVVPGGAITVSGALDSSVVFGNQTQAVATVDLGPQSLLSTAGAVVLAPNLYGTRLGTVLNGGVITVSGNIVAESGAILDVSGASGVLDLAPAETSSLLLTGLLTRVTSVATRINSNAGTIILSGAQELIAPATLLGRSSAQGGGLVLSCGLFSSIEVDNVTTPLNVTLTVAQTQQEAPFSSAGSGVIGNPVVDAAGNALSGGWFAIDSFEAGGFDSLTLNGTVKFQGNGSQGVTVTARGSINAGSAGVIYSNCPVSLIAPYVKLGMAFQTPAEFINQTCVFQDSQANPITFAPQFGAGSLNVKASLVDIGNLSLQEIGSASITASRGDIRGDGTLDIAGALTLCAAQIYPPTQTSFTIDASDYIFNGGSHSGSVTIEGSGESSLPLSACGALVIYATDIVQGGTLRAPFGTINLGWDGSGTAPVDLLTGNAVNSTVNLTLSAGSDTSVSGIDPTTGKAIVVPYGTVQNETNWIAPSDIDITGGNITQKMVNLSANNVVDQAGAKIDISGGGDLFAYEFVPGTGGTKDILSSPTRFAIIPGYKDSYAPVDPTGAYSNGSLGVGSCIYLAASGGLSAGYYTLLPAGYALLPGAYLVTPVSGNATAATEQADGSSLVGGFIGNRLNSSPVSAVLASEFDVASSALIRTWAQYDQSYANTFLANGAATNGAAVPRLPVDAGQLVMAATQMMVLHGAVTAKSGNGGLGGMVDISSPLDILIAGATSPAGVGANTLVLDSLELTAFDAQSLLIGGYRTTGEAGVTVKVSTNKLTVDNAGAVLTAADLILVANESLTLAQGAAVESSGKSSTADAGTLILGNSAIPGSGDGALLRVSADSSALSVRYGVNPSDPAALTIGAGARVSGAGVTLDSTQAALLDPSAILNAKSLAVGSCQISLLLENPGVVQPTVGLVLSTGVLQGLESSAQSLLLRSYSSIDIYGTGEIGVLDQSGQPVMAGLSLEAAAIRGFNNDGGTAIFVAQKISLDNSPDGVASESAGTPTGSLIFNASSIVLGANQLTIGRYATVEFNAGGGVLAKGTGVLAVQGALTINTPLVTGATGASETVSASGALTLSAPADGLAPTVTGGLGASLALVGASVTDNSKIQLSSGNLTLQATDGDVVIGNLAASLLDVGGTVRRIYDLNEYTSGGKVSLVSTGNVDVASGGTISVAAQPAAGDAGTLSVSANGSLTIAGALLGQGGKGGANGNFSLDARSMIATQLDSLETALFSGGFTQSQTIRLRSGDAVIDGVITAKEFNLSTDAGSITVSGKIDASGATGGAIELEAAGSVTLFSGALLTVEGANFSASGKGGAVALEAGCVTNGVSNANAFVDIQAGSTINLSVDSNTSSSAGIGHLTGTLLVAAPQTTDGADLQVKPIDGTIIAASSINVEGTKIFDTAASGGAIDSVESAIEANGTAFLGPAGTTNAAYTSMVDRLLANNSGLRPVLVMETGAKVINSTASLTPLAVTLNTANSSRIILNSAGIITFPNGTPGNDEISVSGAGTVGYYLQADGSIVNITAGIALAIPSGAAVHFVTGVTISFAKLGTDGAAAGGGPIPLVLPPAASFVANNAATLTPTGAGNTVQLSSAGSSKLTVNSGGTVTFANGTPGNDQVTFSSVGVLTTPGGATTSFGAGSSMQIAAGSTVTLNSGGTITFARGSGGSIAIVLPASGSYTLAGANTVIGANQDLTLDDTWDLSNYRFGPASTAGVLTLRTAGNLNFAFGASLSDGFDTSGGSLWQAPLLASGATSWSYRLVAGADLSGADFRDVQPLVSLGNATGSLLLGLGSPLLPANANSTSSSIIPTYFQTIRTGSGDIDIYAGGDVQLLNNLATVYSAGTQAPALDNFDTPLLTGAGVGYPAQYSMDGGNVTIVAQNNIAHYKISGAGTTATLVDDSSLELPTNWLYRQGNVNSVTDQFALNSNHSGTVESTSWWVDFSNFFEGVGALGGGNVTLLAGNNIRDVDAVIPTNARVTYQTALGDKLASDQVLVELGGGDLVVKAGNDINGGVYYVERGAGKLVAGGDILTNSTRATLTQAIVSANANANIVPDSTTWLPTTLFLGDGSFSVSAGGDILLGPVANPFLLPQGVNNTTSDRTYFSTYAENDSIEVSSLTGDLTLKDNAAGGVGSLFGWYQNVQLALTLGSYAQSQPWLKSVETSLTPFSTVFGLMPATLRATAFSGDINLAGNLTLLPSPTGTIDLTAAGAINGFQVSARANGESSWTTSQIDLSDADPNAIPGILTPLSLPSSFTRSYTYNGLYSDLDSMFAESGATDDVLKEKQALHGSGLLHANDPAPVHLYAGTGSISGVTLYSAKAARIAAGVDITDIAFYIQNVRAEGISLVSAGRDLIAYDPDSPSRVAALADPLNTASPALAGDIQIGGVGTLEVLTGRNLNLGVGPSNSGGTAVGIASVGNACNPYLPFAGANIVLGAGIAGLNSVAQAGLGDSEVQFAAFQDKFVTSANGRHYLAELGGPGFSDVSFADLTSEQQEVLDLQIFYLILRDAGRDHNNPNSVGYENYAVGFEAIKTLFPGSHWQGDISLTSREIKTTSGGDITIFAPGGSLLVGYDLGQNQPVDQGILTEDGGNIHIFTLRNVAVGTSRIFTLGGGNEIIWSSLGNIDAGAASRTVQSAPPTRVIFDLQSGAVETDLAGLATGGGIGGLKTLPGVPAGDVDLIAPGGSVNAGDAGIRVSGNLNVAALSIFNAGNIQVGGASTGLSVIVVPNISLLTEASNTTGAATSAASELSNQKRNPAQLDEAPSIFTVDVIGYGEGDVN